MGPREELPDALGHRFADLPVLCQPVFLPPQDGSRAAPFEAEARRAVAPVELEHPAREKALAQAVLGELEQQQPGQQQPGEQHLVLARRFPERLQDAMAALPQEHPPAQTASLLPGRPAFAALGPEEPEQRWRPASQVA